MPSLRCLLLASSIAFSARSAAAEPSAAAERALRLSWVRSASAASCPDVAHVEADVERRLGWSPFARGSGASESIEALVSRDKDVFRAVIELRAADGASQGSREVESPAASCASLAAAAGLAIALMIEPLLPTESESRPALAPPAATPAEMPAAAAVKAPTGAASKPLPARTEPEQSLSLGAIGLSRVLPQFSLGVTLVADVRVVNRLYAVVSGSLLPEQRQNAGGANVGFGLSLASVGGCYRLPFAESWSISSCAALLLGSMQVIVTIPEPQATVANPDQAAPGSRLWWAGSAGLRLGWNFGRFEAALGLDALAHFSRQRYVIERPNPTSFFVEPAAAAAGSFVWGVHY
jgi:hypothetical protein